MNGCPDKWCGVGYDGNGHSGECLEKQALLISKSKTRCKDCNIKIMKDHVYCSNCAYFWVESSKKSKQLDLCVGNYVIDIDKNEGVVVKIKPGIDVVNHGTVYVWQINKLNYSADNCEHYSHFEWNKNFKIKW